MLKYQLCWLRSDFVLLFSNTACPGSSPCPAVSCDMALHGRGFPEKWNKAELSKQKGVYGVSPTGGRDQGGWCASSHCVPAHPSTSVVQRYIRQVCPHQEPPVMPPWCHHNASCFHEMQTDPQQLPQNLHPFRWKEEEKKFKKKEEYMITWSFWHRFFPNQIIN